MQEQAHSESSKPIFLSDKAMCSRGKKRSPRREAVSSDAPGEIVARGKGMYDKRTSLPEAVRRCLKDGMHISIGGLADTRLPVASIHEIIRRGVCELTLSVQSNSICCELLAGAMILNADHLSISRIELAWSSQETRSRAPLLHYLRDNDMVQLDEYTDSSMSARFKAGAMGVPFLPTADHGGNDIGLKNRGKMTVCPFTGENIYLVPACRPDLTLIHVQAADMYGNGRIFGNHGSCREMARASLNTIVTTEEIISNASIQNYPNLTDIPFYVVDAVVDQPFGATPGACYGNYGLNLEEIMEFNDICDDFCETDNKEKLRDYYNRYIFDMENFDDFLEQKPYPVLQQLCQNDGDQPIILD